MAFDSARSRTVAALLALVTLASCATSSHPPETRAEPARVGDHAAGTFTYKGRTIVFDEAVEPPLLMIDGKSIKVWRSTARETRYGTSSFSYADYPSLGQLARAMIDAGVPGL